MALDADAVDVAVSGAVSFGTTTLAAPTDAESPLPVGYRDVGYISDDGVTENRDRSTNDIPAWQGGAIVRTVVTEGKLTISFTMIETNRNSVELFYGRPIAADGSVEIDPAATGGRRRVVLDYVDGDKFVRLFLPDCEVVEVGEITIAGTEAVGYEITITAYKDVVLGYSGKKWFSALAS